MQTLVAVPTYNERENLTPLIERVLAVAPDADVLVIDDASPDGTGLLAEAISRCERRVSVLHRSHRLGLGTAYVAAFRHALARGYERVVQMDADLSHNPDDLPRLIAATRRAHVAVGSRAISGGGTVGWPGARQLLSRAGSRYARAVLGLPLRDCTSGFKCLRREALLALDLDRVRSTGFAFQVEVNFACAQAGMILAEVPITFHDRRWGRSKLTGAVIVEAALLVLRLRVEGVRGQRTARAEEPQLAVELSPASVPPVVAVPDLTRTLDTALGRAGRPRRGWQDAA